jgi:hypothetical protein
MTRPKSIGAVAAALLGIAALGSTSASAATEFGDNCTGTSSTNTPATLFALTAVGNPLPLTAPTSGVITRWKSSLGPIPGLHPQTLRVLRQNSVNTVQIVGESPGSVSPGVSVFDARVPVLVGDRLGLYGTGPKGVFFCEVPGPESIFGVVPGAIGTVGQTVGFAQVPDDAGIPVAALIEPDADNDGYGDETQDKCPQSAASHGDCPVVTTDVLSVVKRKGSVVVLLTASSAAAVKVAGTANLGKDRKAKLSSKAQTVTPGKVSRFTLKFPKGLKKRLQELTSKQSLQLKVTASATDVVGRVTTDKLKVRLKGQASG